MSAETDLLPCPWCGDARVHAYYDEIRHTGYVCCMNRFPQNAQCGRTVVVSVGVDYNTPAKVKREAGRRWNQQARANLAELQREVEALRAEGVRLAEVHAGYAAQAFTLTNRTERLAEALRVAREYVVSELAGERAKFAGYEHCSTIASIEADIAKIDAALEQGINDA